MVLQHLSLIVALDHGRCSHGRHQIAEFRVTRYVKGDDESGESCLDPSQTFREKIKVKSCCQGRNDFSVSWALFSAIVREG